MRENINEVAGISLKPVEDARKDAVVKEFNFDYFSCYTRSSDVLKNLGTYVYAQGINRHLIAAYMSKIDTTPVMFTHKVFVSITSPKKNL